MKGRTESVVCFTADDLGSQILHLVPSPSETPYVGRAATLERLMAEWRSTSQGTARVLEVVGEAGVGKTRVLAHFFATAGTTAEQVLYTRADTPPRTFGPLLQLLPSVIDVLSPALRERVAGLLHDEDEARPVDPDWLVDLMAELIGALSANDELAFVLDDVHRRLMVMLHSLERPGGLASAFVDGDARLSDLAWVAAYRLKASFGSFTPHITLGHVLCELVDEALLGKE